MGVFISDNDLNTFKENGITEEQIKDTISQYRDEGVSDDEIRIKIDNKLKSFSPQEQSQPVAYEEGKLLEGNVTKNIRNYKSRFPDRNGNIFSNATKDVVDTVKGLGQIIGNANNFLVARPLMNVVLGDKSLPWYKRLWSGEGIKDIKNTWNNAPNTLYNLKEGLKENYGQGGVDIISNKGLNFDVPGFVQSFYAHPLNLLDLVGVGEVGKIKNVANVTKGGKVSKFTKTVGNNTLSPKYSENLVYNAGQRLAETKPFQSVINTIDNSPFRGTTDLFADFLNLNPDSRLMGKKGAAVRQAKLIEQANQTKNIAERNAAIAENTKNLSGLSESEAKGLIQSIENPNSLNLPFEEYSHKPYQAIEKLLYEKNGYVPNAFHNKELGDIDLVWGIGGKDGYGLSHIIDQRNMKNNINGVDFVRKLPDTVENGKVYDHPNNPNKKIIMDENNKIAIALDFNGEKRKWIITAFTPNKEEIAKIKAEIERPSSYVPGSDITLEKGTYSIPKLNSADNIITDNAKNFNPPNRKSLADYREILKNKVESNAKAYKDMGKLTNETVEELPINTYASIKYNKPIIELSDAEKLEAFKDIEKMPKEQQPFYIPMMYDDKLRASDFFANTTKNYKPNELKQRKVGMGLEENRTGGKRIYDPVELANRLDAHRIKMINTENMINEIKDNFAKPYNQATDKLLDGYVPFNPDSFLKFYRKSMDLNEITIRKLDELNNIDTVLKESIEESIKNTLKESIQESIKKLPKDIVEMIGVTKNNNIYQIPEEVAKSLMSGKNSKGIWEMMLDMGTAGFKRKVLGLSPKWFINNRIGNGIMAGLKGVNVSDYAKALNISEDLLPDALRTKSMYEAEKTIIGRTGGSNNGFFGNTMRLLGGEFIDTSDLKGIKKASVTLANSLGVPGKTINTITDAMFRFNQRFEDFERRAAYIHSVNTVGKKMMKTTGQNIVKQDELLKATIENPKLLDAVMKDVDNTLGDYINMTSVERRGLRKIIPFYSWLRTITRYTLSLAESNPIRANLANKISMLLGEENEDLPEYQRGSVATKFYSQKTQKPLRLNYEHSIPFSTFGETADNPIGLLNPLITQSLEAIQGKRNFMNRPFVSPNYENVFPNGYASLMDENQGEYFNELPMSERLWALPVGLARTSVPALDWTERVGVGTLQNLLGGQGLKPKDALFDTSFGGYNYNEGFYKRPKGWSNEEQLLKLILPLQQEGKVRKRVKTKRK